MTEPPKYKSLTVHPNEFGPKVAAAEAAGYEVMGSPKFSDVPSDGTLLVSVMLVRGYKRNPRESESLLRALLREHNPVDFGHIDVFKCGCSRARAYRVIKDALERGVL